MVSKSSYQRLNTLGKSFSLLALLIIQGCFSSANYAEARTQVGDVRRFQVSLEGVRSVELQLPAGDVLVSHTTDSELTAELTIYCPDLTSRCSQRLENMEFVSRRQGDKLVLDTKKGFGGFLGSRQLKIEVFVPTVDELTVKSMAGDIDVRNIVANSLAVDVNAGDLDMSGLQVCPSVNQEAGDIDISLPYELVSSVDLDVGVGDASLTDRGDRHTARRSWLVGAELGWRSGNTGCDVLVDLQAGDARVELTGG